MDLDNSRNSLLWVTQEVQTDVGPNPEACPSLGPSSHSGFPSYYTVNDTELDGAEAGQMAREVLWLAQGHTADGSHLYR